LGDLGRVTIEGVPLPRKDRHLPLRPRRRDAERIAVTGDDESGDADRELRQAGPVWLSGRTQRERQRHDTVSLEGDRGSARDPSATGSTTDDQCRCGVSTA